MKLAKRARLPTLALLAASLSCLLAAANAECFQPNGTIMPNDTPCNPNAAASVCCGTGWYCLSDGVCQLIQNNQYFYYRGSCTDKSWASNLCPSFCLNFNTTVSWPLGKCPTVTDQYCCDGDNSCDCDSGFDTVKLGGAAAVSTVTVIGDPHWTTLLPSTAPSASTASTASNATSSTTTLPMSTTSFTSSTASTASSTPATSTTPQTSSLTTSQTSSLTTSQTSPTTDLEQTASPSPTPASSTNVAAIAAGVTVPVCVLLAALIGFLLFWRRKRRAQPVALPELPGNGVPPPAGYYTDKQPPLAEIQGDEVGELDGGKLVEGARPAELD